MSKINILTLISVGCRFISNAFNSKIKKIKQKQNNFLNIDTTKSKLDDVNV